MITNQQSGLYIGGNADYAGFGAFNLFSYLSGSTTPPPSVTTGSDKQFIGEIQQLGLGSILDASIGIT